MTDISREAVDGTTFALRHLHPDDVDLTNAANQLDALLDAAEGRVTGTAPSDKIAEAADMDVFGARRVIDAYDMANPMRTADMHPAACHCHRCAIDWLRALAGKGE